MWSVEHNRAEDEVEVIEKPKELQNQLGGAGQWEGLVVGLQNSSRFQRAKLEEKEEAKEDEAKFDELGQMQRLM